MACFFTTKLTGGVNGWALIADFGLLSLPSGAGGGGGKSLGGGGLILI
jgi:hypothetical protein